MSKEGKKLKCPLDTKVECPSYVSQENAIFTLLLELKQFQSNYLEEFLSRNYQVDDVRCDVSFFINILLMVLHKKYHKQVVSTNEFAKGQVAIQQVIDLEV